MEKRQQRGPTSSWILPVRQGDMPAMLKVARIPDEEAGYRLFEDIVIFLNSFGLEEYGH
ncbi:Aminoglycoside 3'-phosphotransferase 2 Streptomycin 3'-kinase StrB [Bacillus subtilis]|uniref:hypothetical protein n=1 Tax=Bacillus subtilis TaxID=1423 RepID=UPI0007B28D4D|nr:hypothetical protein [Bacillus subtilis]KZD86030.1 Aminoglycoside 3'-phosphotransferase 2 Streptomycin 3'-kinase StrB [Bacillus subtilis]